MKPGQCACGPVHQRQFLNGDVHMWRFGRLSPLVDGLERLGACERARERRMTPVSVHNTATLDHGLRVFDQQLMSFAFAALTQVTRLAAESEPVKPSLEVGDVARQAHNSRPIVCTSVSLVDPHIPPDRTLV